MPFVSASFSTTATPQRAHPATRSHTATKTATKGGYVAPLGKVIGHEGAVAVGREHRRGRDHLVGEHHRHKVVYRAAHSDTNVKATHG